MSTPPEPPKRPNDTIRPIEWSDAGLRLLDQRRLPERSEWLVLRSASEVAGAIRDMVVRGAPAIGIAAAYGAVLAARERYGKSPGTWKDEVTRDLELLGEARPTAVNLRWALRRMASLIAAVNGDPADLLLAGARRLHDEDIAANYRMGDHGAALIAARSREAAEEDLPCGVLTHCNAGSLATGGYGTALGVIRSAWGAGWIGRVLADETRPWLQGARLTAWELVQDGIPVELIADGAATWAMARGRVRWVIVGADRIAANGDTANKIGTCGLAVSARYHGVGFMVVAPTSTIDLELAEGGDIPIEARSRDELLEIAGRRVAAEGAGAWNPVFDVTPADLIDAIVTERGVVERPDREKMAALMT